MFKSGTTSGEDFLMVNNIIGLTGGMEHEDDFLGLSKYGLSDEEQITISEQLMLKNMEELLDKSESYYELFLGLRHLEERYQYLKDEGFIVYGAVVTGPVKELLKLQDLSFIQGEQLGEVELWNWKTRD